MFERCETVSKWEVGLLFQLPQGDSPPPQTLILVPGCAWPRYIISQARHDTRHNGDPQRSPWTPATPSDPQWSPAVPSGPKRSPAAQSGPVDALAPTRHRGDDPTGAVVRPATATDATQSQSTLPYVLI